MTYRQKRSAAGILFLAPYLISFCAFILLPILVSLTLSVMQFDMTAPHSTRFVGMHNYQEAWKDDYFWQALRATFGYVVLMVPGLIVTALGMALGLHGMAMGRNTVRAL